MVALTGAQTTEGIIDPSTLDGARERGRGESWLRQVVEQCLAKGGEMVGERVVSGL